MSRKLKPGRLIVAVIILLLGYALWYAWNAFPIISGYGSKNLCSAIYIQHRNPTDVLKEELADFPKSLASYSIDEKNASVTGSVWGLAKKTTIYRPGLGCTLINDITEAELRAQHFNLPASPYINTDSIAWPAGDKLPDTLPTAINKAALDYILENAMYESFKGSPSFTRAILVVYDGQLVAEKYAPGFNRKSVMLGWSMSKSLTAAMIGILVKQDKLKISAPAPVPEWKGTAKQAITIENLLQQASGIDYEEIYTSPRSVTTMLFKKGDMAAYAASLPLKYQPGTVFNYSGGNSNILSRIIRQTVGEAAYAAFPYQSLFYKCGMYSMLLEPDASGTYIGSSYSYATPRDFARFGLLYYNNGSWNGEQVLPEGWVKATVRPAPAAKQKNYGYQFWLNGIDSKDSTKHIYPDVPGDMYYADGYGGQDIYIIPSRKLVVVRLGVHTIDENKLLKEIMSAVAK